jgi:hypothetical protein
MPIVLALLLDVLKHPYAPAKQLELGFAVVGE